MIDISIIVFLVSLVAIIVMFVAQYRRLKATGQLGMDFPSKDLSYESFQSFSKKLGTLWLTIIHTVAIILSKLWARLTHYLASGFNKAAKKIEHQIIKTEKRNGAGGRSGRSVFLTTVKAYKHEIKKLKGRVEEEKPRPRDESGLAKSSEKNRIE